MIEPETRAEDVADDNSRLSTAALADTRPAPPTDEQRSFSDPAAAGASSLEAEQEGRASLYSPEEAQRLRDQWGAVQASFVDEPRHAVEQADNLVAVALKHLAETFAQERSGLERQWDRGDDVSTEDLRLVLRKYRSFFDRLLAI